MTLQFIGALPDHHWHQVLAHYLDHADTWVLHMPAGPGPLSNGRDTFAALPHASTGPWSGMCDALTLTGPLSSPAAAAFTAAEGSLVDLDPQRKLWDYQLLRAGEVVLQVADFTDLLINEPDPVVLARLGLSDAALARP